MIIIPTYNEEKNIRQLIQRIRAKLPVLPILFVDDNSPDGTAKEIKIIQSTDKNIHLIVRPSKAGLASAYLDAFKLATQEYNPEFIVIMDADLSHAPEEIPELIKLVLEGKVAIGSRYIEGGAVKNWKLRRKILSRVANWYAQLLTKLPIADMTSGFMAIPMDKLRQLDLTTILNRGYTFSMQLKVRLAALGAQIVEVPITFEERKVGESKLTGSIIAQGIKYPARLFASRQIKENYVPWLIFFISFIVYLLTLPHTIFFGDSPEFMASAISLGIPHPSGYPTYVLLAKLFTVLPFGNVEFGVGLLSAVCGSLSLVLFYYLFQRISPNRFIALVSALILGFSNIFWSQAIFAKVYMPLLLFVLVILLLLDKFWETNKSGYLVGAMFLFGLGAGLHLIILLFLPLLLFAVIVYVLKLKDPFGTRFSYGALFGGIFVFLLGLAVYIYLPLRNSSPGNYYDFSKIFRLAQPSKSFSGFVDYILRTDYNDFGGAFSINDKLLLTGAVFIYIWNQFFWFLILVPFGLWKLWSTKKKFFVLTFGAMLLNILGIILLRSGGWGYENDYLYSFYYLVVYAMFALWIGLGLVVVVKFVESKIPYKPVVLGILMLLPIYMFSQNITTNNLRNFTFVDDYTRQLLQSLPPNAVLLANYDGANTDTLLFGLHYQQTAKHLREDVTILTSNDIYPQIDRNIINSIYGLSDPKRARYYLLNYVVKSAEFKDRPIYTTYLTDNLGNSSWTEISNGLVYKFFPTSPTSLVSADYYQLNYEKDLTILNSNIFGQNLLGQYFYTQASYWIEQNDLNKAQLNYINGIKYDYKVSGIDQQDFMFYRSKILKKI